MIPGDIIVASILRLEKEGLKFAPFIPLAHHQYGKRLKVASFDALYIIRTECSVSAGECLQALIVPKFFKFSTW